MNNKIWLGSTSFDFAISILATIKFYFFSYEEIFEIKSTPEKKIQQRKRIV